MNPDARRNLIVCIAIPLVSIALHFHVFTRDIVGFHAWRQTQTESNIDNFYSEDANILHPRINGRGDGDGIFRTDFPLMQWLVAQVFRVLGPGILWSRAANFLIGLLTLLGFHILLLNVFSRDRLTPLGVWAFCFSPLFYYFTINPMPDNLALCFSVWGMGLFFRYLRTKTTVDAALAALFTGLAALVKLPFAAALAGVGGYALVEWAGSGFGRRKDLLLLALLYGIMLIPAAAWYAAVIPGWGGNGIVPGILATRLPAGELLNIARFNLTSSLPELLINYAAVVFFVAGIVSLVRRRLYRSPGFPVLFFWGIALILYFLFEMNMIRYVHDYYLLPFLPPVFIIVFEGIRRLAGSPARFSRTAAAVCLLLLPLTAFLRIDHRWSTESPGFNRDLLVYKPELRGAVPDDALCVAGNDESRHIIFYYIGKKGWGFDNNRLDADTLRGMIRRGAEYLYSDSRVIDESGWIRPLLGDLVMEKGSIRIHRLKSDRRISTP